MFLRSNIIKSLKNTRGYATGSKDDFLASLLARVEKISENLERSNNITPKSQSSKQSHKQYTQSKVVRDASHPLGSNAESNSGSNRFNQWKSGRNQNNTQRGSNNQRRFEKSNNQDRNQQDKPQFRRDVFNKTVQSSVKVEKITHSTDILDNFQPIVGQQQSTRPPSGQRFSRSSENNKDGQPQAPRYPRSANARRTGPGKRSAQGKSKDGSARKTREEVSQDQRIATFGRGGEMQALPTEYSPSFAKLDVFQFSPKLSHTLNARVRTANIRLLNDQGFVLHDLHNITRERDLKTYGVQVYPFVKFNYEREANFEKSVFEDKNLHMIGKTPLEEVENAINSIVLGKYDLLAPTKKQFKEKSSLLNAQVVANSLNGNASIVPEIKQVVYKVASGLSPVKDLSSL